MAMNSTDDNKSIINKWRREKPFYKRRQENWILEKSNFFT